MTKKAAALLLAASLAVSVCATPVFATGTHGTEVSGNASTPNTKSETTVEYKVTEGYTWAIPATIDFGSNASVKKKRTVVADQEKDSSNYSAADADKDGSSGNVYVSDCRLKPGTKLTISISSTTQYETTDDKGFFVKTTNGSAKAKLYYEIYKEKVASTATPTTGKLNNTSQILELKAGTDADSQDLTFILTTGTEGEIAGDYKGTVVFEAKVDKAT